jgi:hypothetical protein
MSPLARFAWGAFGAFAVEFVRLWKLRDDNFGRPHTYYLLALGMVFVAGAWTIAVAARDLILAQVVTGATAPAAISALASRDGPGKKPERRDEDGSSDTGDESTTMNVGTDDSPTPSFSREFHHYLRSLAR